MQGIWQGWTGRSGLGLKAPGCNSPVTVPEACGSTGENQPRLSGSPPFVPAELGPPSPSRAGPGRGGRAWVDVRGSALGAAHTPYTDVHQRMAVDQAVVQGIHQTHGILLQDHQHVLALAPGTIWGLAPAAGLGQLLDAVIYCNTALPWYQVLFGYLYPAQRADCKALSPWLHALDVGFLTIPGQRVTLIQ